MNILITGAGGFLGRHIIEQLTEQPEYHIFATSLNADDLKTKLEIIEFILNEAILDFDFSQIDLVINCAFPRGANGVDFANGLDFLNKLFTKIEPFEKCGVIDISSQSVYSSSRETAADENTQIEFEALYDIGKYCMELLADARLSKHRRVHLRLASLIGVGFNQRIVNRFAKMAVAGERIEINGGKQLFGYLDVRDCASAICRVVKQWNNVDATGQVYNIGPERSYSLLEIAQTAINVGKEFGFEGASILVHESDDWNNSSIVSTKFRQLFNWRPQYILEDTMRAIYYDLTQSR